MANTLGSVEIDLIARVGKLEADMAKAQRTVRTKTQSMAADARKHMKAIGAAFAAAGVASVGFAVRQIGVVDAMAKAAKAAGISAESLQELRFAADRSGVSTKQLDEGMRRFNRRLGLFIQDGGGPAAKAFEQLGIQATDAGGKVKSTETVFNEVVRALGDVENQAELAAIASQLFGDDAGPKLALLLAEGETGIASLRAEARQYGIVTNESAQASEAAADALTNVKAILSGALQRAIADNAGAITRMAEGFADLTLNALEFWGIIQTADERVREYQRLTAAVEEQRRVVERLTEQYGENSDAVVNAQYELIDLNQQRGEEIRKLREAGIDLSTLSKKRQEETQAIESSNTASGNLGQTISGPLSRAMAALETHLKNTKVAADDLSGKGANASGGLTGVHDKIEEVTVTAERMLGPALQSLMTDFENTASGVKGAADEVDDLDIKVISNTSSIEDWAKAIELAFGDIEGRTGEVVRSVSSLIGVFNELAAVRARQGGTLTLAQQAGFGAQIGGITGNLLGIQGPSGQAGSALGGLGGYIAGSALTAGMTGILGMAGGPIGAIIGAAIGGLLGQDEGETNPRITIGNNRLFEELDRGDPEGIAARYLTPFSRRSALGVTVQGTQITEALGGQAAQEILNKIVEFDQAIADIVRSTGLGDLDKIKEQLLGPGASRTYEEGVRLSEILADRFNIVLGGFDQRIQSLVGTVADAEDGFRRLGAAVTLIDQLDNDALSQYQQVLERANMTMTDVLQEQSESLLDLARDYSGSTQELERLAAGTQAFNQAVVQTLVNIDRASATVSEITGSTKDSLEFRRVGIQGGQDAQVDFLLRRAQQLQQEIGSLGSAAAVQNQVQLINSLIAQAGGLVSDEGFEAFLAQIQPLLDGSEDLAQQRLNTLREGVEEIAQSTTEALQEVAGDLTPAAATISTAADRQADAADTLFSGANIFRENVAFFGDYVRNLPSNIQIVIPGPGEVNAAG